MRDFTPGEVAEQLSARGGLPDEQAAAIGVVASAIAEAIALGPAKVTDKSQLPPLRPASWPTMSNSAQTRARS
ncbi:MAG: hypothetical protein RL198_282 [Actinomycetota bacterium]|jgi:hypothetical protein